MNYECSMCSMIFMDDLWMLHFVKKRIVLELSLYHVLSCVIHFCLSSQGAAKSFPITSYVLMSVDMICYVHVIQN